MEGRANRKLRLVLSLLILVAIIPSAGCIVGLPAQIGWMIWGLKQPAAYEELKGERVAVLCYAAHSSDPSNSMRMLNNKIHLDLATNVKKIEMVPRSEIADWTDFSGMSERRLIEIGTAVKADKVVSVKLHSYSLYQGTELLKGRVAYTVSVYDMTEGGTQVWASTRDEWEFPRHSAVPVIETNESTFEQQFIEQLGARIARNFYASDAIETYAEEDSGF